MNSFKHLSNPEQALLCPEISRGVQGTQQDLQLNFFIIYSLDLVLWTSICRATCMVFGVVFSK